MKIIGLIAICFLVIAWLAVGNTNALIGFVMGAGAMTLALES
jgi:hypothetical protein